MRQPPTRGLKATLHKVFILDAQGGYAGEYLLDDSCIVEFSEFLAAVPHAGLRDGQTVFLNEWKATAIHGERLSLIAISKGSLGPEELAWAKGALVAAEAHLVRAYSPGGPDKGVMESLARALEEREARLKERETVVADLEARTKAAAEAYRREKEAEITMLRQQLAEAQSQHAQDVRALAAERDRLHRELEAFVKAPKPAVPSSADSKLEAERRQMELDRRFLQKRALELLAREEAVRERETKAEEEIAELAKMRGELEAARAEIDAAKSAQPLFDVEGARREIEARVRILQQKAFDLLEREERLRKRAEEIQTLLET